MRNGRPLWLTKGKANLCAQFVHTYLAHSCSASKHDRAVDGYELLHQKSKSHGIHGGNQKVEVRDYWVVLEGGNNLFPWFQAARVEVHKVTEEVARAW